MEHSLSHTKVIIKNYDGNTYKENFRGLNGTKISLAETDYGEIISRKKGENARLFVKDIYVQDLENAEFSYNVYNLELEESRNIANHWDLEREIRKIWCKVDNKKLWSKLLRAMNEDAWESKLDFDDFWMNTESKKALNESFVEEFGEDAVIGTKKEWSREAEWRGADVIHLDSLKQLTEVIPNDQKYVEEDQNKEVEPIERNNLTQEELENLEMVEEFIDKIDKNEWKVPSDLEIIPVQMEIKERAGQANLTENKIYLNVHRLGNKLKTGKTFVHELAHIVENTKDLTKAHLSSIEKMASRILLSYMEDSY
jgi:hypothetical protein